MNKNDLEKEFKKLNFALKTHKTCDYSAEFSIENNHTGLFLINNANGDYIFAERYVDITEKEVYEFKKKCVHTCTGRF